jgi:aryl-alcohol dehydrogenase-like predicted oxidoreductase
VLYRRLGRTGLEVSALALGTVELGLDYGIPAPGHYGRPSATEGVRLVHAALDAGINFIDTARGYGGSEAVLGQALTGRRDRVILATKVARPADNPTGAALRQAMLASLDESLSALVTGYVDVWIIRNPD